MASQFAFGGSSGGQPFPTLDLTLVDEAGHTTSPLIAIVGTGADGTLVPLLTLRQAGFQASRKRRNLVVGDRRLIESVVGYEVTVTIGDVELPGVDVYGSREIDEVVLGRDVLNQLVFTYEGPRRLLDILGP